MNALHPAATVDLLRARRTSARAWLITAWTSAALLIGCGGGQAPTLGCVSDAGCPAGSHCGPTGTCVGDVPCTNDAACCVAERCNAGVCRRRLGCSAVAACAEPSMQCTDAVCAHPRCEADADCVGGARCVFGVCARSTPCDGRCPVGEGCAARLDRCVAAPAACPPGQLAVIVDEAGVWHEGCGPRVTACWPLPALAPPQPGLPARLLDGDDAIWDVGYDPVYGDLVVARRARDAGHALLGAAHVAGVPVGAAVVGDPAGPRGGVAEAGPDAGDPFAAVVLPDGALALAAADAAGGVRWLEVDAGLKVRRDILLDPRRVQALAAAVGKDGVVHIAAFVPGDAATPARLELWRPAAAEGEDTARELLVATPIAAAPPAPWRALPRGRGAMLALVVDGLGRRWVAAYDAYSGDLGLLVPKGDKHTLELLTHDAIPGGSGDFGRFPTMAEHGDGVVIAMQDHDRGRLLWARWAGGAFEVRVVDDGMRADGHHRVGAEPALLAAGAESFELVAQDSTAARLVRYRLEGEVVTALEALPKTGTGGFSPSSLLLGDGKQLVASATLRLSATGALEVSRDWLDVVVGNP